MRIRIAMPLLIAGWLTVSLVEMTSAQAPAPPTTIWSFLGIPQAANAVHAQLFNRCGKLPCLEKKPPLKTIADPANLKSDVPAIKAAAEIKQAEDLKKQKIKAIKYLATIGCGCYDKDGKVTKALLAAMDDCTEEVRLAAVNAIAEAGQSEMCANCRQRSCCNEKITEQLAKIAYELDQNGCYLEPSERVRQAAVQALAICCPQRAASPPAEQPAPIEGAKPTPRIEGAETNKPESDAPPPPPKPTGNGSVVVPPGRDSAAVSPGVNPYAGTRPVSRLVSSRRTANQQNGSLGSAPVAPQQAALRGAVMLVDKSRMLAHVHFAQGTPPARVGSRLQVYVPVDDRLEQAGEFEVVRVFPGSAHVRPVEGLDLGVLPRGAVVAGAGD